MMLCSSSLRLYSSYKFTSTPPGHTMRLILISKSNWFILELLVSSCLEFQRVRTAALTQAHFSLFFSLCNLTNTVMRRMLQIILVSQSWILLMLVPSYGFRFLMRACSRSLTKTCVVLVLITGIGNNLLLSAITSLPFEVVNRGPSIRWPVNSVWTNLLWFTTHNLMGVLQPMANFLACIGNLPMFKVKKSLWYIKCGIGTAKQLCYPLLYFNLSRCGIKDSYT